MVFPCLGVAKLSFLDIAELLPLKVGVSPAWDELGIYPGDLKLILGVNKRKTTYS